MGYTALLLFAGLQTIPETCTRRRAMDGAGELRTFWRITLPLLRPVLALVLIITVIGSFQVFDTVAVATTGRGGPVNASPGAPATTSTTSASGGSSSATRRRCRSRCWPC